MLKFVILLDPDVRMRGHRCPLAAVLPGFPAGGGALHRSLPRRFGVQQLRVLALQRQPGRLPGGPGRQRGDDGADRRGRARVHRPLRAAHAHFREPAAAVGSHPIGPDRHRHSDWRRGAALLRFRAACHLGRPALAKPGARISLPVDHPAHRRFQHGGHRPADQRDHPDDDPHDVRRGIAGVDRRGREDHQRRDPVPADVEPPEGAGGRARVQPHDPARAPATAPFRSS